jgi:hypothetical protein
MSDGQFYAYIRRMGRRLDDPYAPVIRKAVRDELARRGPDPAGQLFQPEAGVTRPTDPELLAIEARIAELRAEQAALEQPTDGVFG